MGSPTTDADRDAQGANADSDSGSNLFVTPYGSPEPEASNTRGRDRFVRSESPEPEGPTTRRPNTYHGPLEPPGTRQPHQPMGVFARGQRLNHGRALLPKAPVRIDAATQIRAEQAAKKRKDDADLEALNAIISGAGGLRRRNGGSDSNARPPVTANRPQSSALGRSATRNAPQSAARAQQPPTMTWPFFVDPSTKKNVGFGGHLFMKEEDH